MKDPGHCEIGIFFTIQSRVIFKMLTDMTVSQATPGSVGPPSTLTDVSCYHRECNYELS